MVMDKEEKSRFLVERDGNSLLTPFQRDLCHFRNVMGRVPVAGSASDILVQKCIRKANLDALWYQEPPMVRGVLDEAN
jgi:hypothetical protein